MSAAGAPRVLGKSSPGRRSPQVGIWTVQMLLIGIETAGQNRGAHGGGVMSL